MKNTYYGNRGMAFEDFIRFANDRYKMRKEAVICKIPTEFLPIRDRTGKIVSCKVEEKSTVDFIGRVKNMPIAMEAKHTATDSIRWDAVQDHQIKFLEVFSSNGDGISIVLVSFKLERFFAVPAVYWKSGRDAWKDAQRKGKRKAEIISHKMPYKDRDGNAVYWSTNGMASLKAKDLLPEWEVKMDGKVGLDYLRKWL